MLAPSPVHPVLSPLTGILFGCEAVSERPADSRYPLRIAAMSGTEQVLGGAPLVDGVLGLRHVAPWAEAAAVGEAVERYASQQYSAVLMDCHMPVMDGLEATQVIRASSWLQRNIPIIALTADVMTEDKERCLQAGMNSFISKPFRLEEIEGVLKKYLSAA